MATQPPANSLDRADTEHFHHHSSIDWIVLVWRLDWVQLKRFWAEHLMNNAITLTVSPQAQITSSFYHP